MFAIPIGIAAPVVFGLARDSGQSLFAPALAIIALAMGLGGLVVYLARRVLEPAEQLERTRVILEDAYDRARAESLRDALTGLGNHRGFQEEFERQWLIARRHGTPLALAMIDLDDFKRVNDQGGHGAGDRCLTLFARTLIGQLRRTDRAFRVGGDEFAILLPQSDIDGAYMTIRRLLAASLEGSTGYEVEAVDLVHRRHQRPARTGRRPRVDVPPGRRGAVLGQAPRPDRGRRVRRRRAMRMPPPGRRPSCRPRSARSPRPAPCAPSSSRSTTCARARSTASRA